MSPALRRLPRLVPTPPSLTTPPRQKARPASRAVKCCSIYSGGQYTGGTTDITRTVAIGDVSRAMKRDYTAVLRAHIALAMLHFPRGAWGAQLDTAARLPLWEIGADYGHGTGHGVGFCLSVHEGPVSISPRSGTSPQARVKPAWFSRTSWAYTRTGRWGVRIENLVTPVVADYLPDQTSEFLNFETLTLCPIDTHDSHSNDDSRGDLVGQRLPQAGTRSTDASGFGQGCPVAYAGNRDHLTHNTIPAQRKRPSIIQLGTLSHSPLVTVLFYKLLDFDYMCYIY